MAESPLTQRDVEALRITLDKLDRTVTDLPDRIDRTYVRKDVLDPLLKIITDAIASQQKTLEGHTGWFTWIARIVVGAVVMAAMSALLYAKAQGG